MFMRAIELKAHCEKLSWPEQIVELAETMRQISTCVTQSDGDDKAIGFMWRAAGIIEFSASKIPQPHLLELAQMQKEILAWKHLWPLDPARSLLALQTRNRSDRLLQMAGLLG
jgi:hypothetical protein